jgi:hypothetical protein
MPPPRCQLIGAGGLRFSFFNDGAEDGRRQGEPAGAAVAQRARVPGRPAVSPARERRAGHIPLPKLSFCHQVSVRREHAPRRSGAAPACSAHGSIFAQSLPPCVVTIPLPGAAVQVEDIASGGQLCSMLYELAELKAMLEPVTTGGLEAERKVTPVLAAPPPPPRYGIPTSGAVWASSGF